MKHKVFYRIIGLLLFLVLPALILFDFATHPTFADAMKAIYALLVTLERFRKYTEDNQPK